MPAISRISIDGQTYNIANVPEAYKVVEVPSHGDIDQKLERRVIWRNFSLGIQRRREDPSLDATSLTSSTFTYLRQVRNPNGVWFTQGGDTTRQDRIFPQRFFGTSNFDQIAPTGDKPFIFIDGSLASCTVTQNNVYTLTPPGTWALSAGLSTAGEVSDAVQYGGQIYVAINPTYGTATSATATTLTNTRANYVPNQFVGALLSMGGSTATVTGNTATVITFPAGWTGGVVPAVGLYSLTKGLYTWNQLSSGSWVQQPATVAASHFAVIREQLWRSLGPSIYDTINTDPTNQIWSGQTIIGDPNTYITDLDVFKDFLIIFKQDGIYSADKTGAVYPLFPGFKTLGTNPRPLGQFEDTYYFASDWGLVWAYSSRGGVRRVGFDFAEPYPMDPSNPTTKFSVPNAVVNGLPLTHYMLVAFNQYNPSSSSSSYTLAWDGNGWHPIHFDSGTVNLSVGLTGGNTSPANPVAHFAHSHNTSGKTHIHYMTNILVDPFLAANFDTSPQVIYFPVDNGALEDEPKVLERVNVIVDNPEAGTVNMAYALDENIATLNFQDMGQPQFQGTKGNQIFSPGSTLPDYNRVGLRLTLACNPVLSSGTGASVAPAIRAVVLHYKQRAPQRRQWDIVILGAEQLVAANGRLDTRPVLTMLNHLNSARQAHRQVIFIDANDQEQQVYVDEVEEDIKVLKANQPPSYFIKVSLFEAVAGQ